MIPKVIHYCWFGGNPLPESAINCINSWKKYMPDYKIKEWNESNFDFSLCKYAKEAYDEKKFAFVSDYARYKIIYEYGGVYFDTDVELIRELDALISSGNYMGMEHSLKKNEMVVNPGLGFASSKGNSLLKEMIDLYEKISFVNPDGTLCVKTIVEYTTEILEKKRFKRTNKIQSISGFKIYPSDYFCPMNYISGDMKITDNTRSIHHYTATWHSEIEHETYVLANKIAKILPFYLADLLATAILVLKKEGLRSMVSKVKEYFNTRRLG